MCFCGCGSSGGNQSPAIAPTASAKVFEPQWTKGAHLLYLIKVSEKVRFNLDIEIISTDPDLRFNFYMNNMDFTFGSVAVTRSALLNADHLQLLFPDGNSLFNDRTALVVSQTVYENLVFSRKARITLESEPEVELLFFENENFSFELNGQPYQVKCLMAKDKKEETSLLIFRNTMYPLVARWTLPNGMSGELLQWKNPSLEQ